MTNDLIIDLLSSLKDDDNGIYVTVYDSIYEIVKNAFGDHHSCTFVHLFDAVDDYFYVSDIEEWCKWIKSLRKSHS